MDVIAGPQQILLGPAYGYSVTSTALAPLTGIPQSVLSNPFPSSNPLQPIPGQSLGRYTQLGDNVSWDDQTMRTAVNDRYTLSLQRQLPGNLVIDGTFFMLLSHDMPYSKDMNMANPELSVQYQSALTQTVANPFYNYLTPSLFPGPLRNAKTVAISSLLVPYPQYGTLTQTNTPGFMSHTYSAELRLRRSFSHGLGFTASYANPVTHTTAFFNTEDTYLNRPTFQSVALPEHSMVVSGTWELPVGKDLDLSEWSAESRGFVSRRLDLQPDLYVQFRHADSVRSSHGQQAGESGTEQSHKRRMVRYVLLRQSGGIHHPQQSGILFRAERSHQLEHR